MNRCFAFLWILILFPTYLICQKAQLVIKPYIGSSNPLGDFKSNNIFAKTGLDLGLHIDKMWNHLGLGLYTGFDNNGISYPDLIPNGNTVPSLTKSKEAHQYNWRQFILGLGPIYQLNLSEKFNVDLSFKLGFAKISYPEYKQYVHVGSPIKESYTLYETKNKDIEKKLNPMLRSTVRLNYKMNSKLSLSLGSNYTHVRDVIHSYRYLDAGLDPTMTTEELIKALAGAKIITEKRKCHFNSFGLTLGLSYNLGKNKNNPKVDSSKIVQPDSCKNQLLQNGDFHHGIHRGSSVSFWTTGYGNPQFLNTPNQGCFDPGFVEFSGNKDQGDAISQSLAINNKVRLGKKYIISVGVRFFANQNTLDYARIRVVAYNGTLSTLNNHPQPNSNLAIIGHSGKIHDCNDWSVIEFPIWAANKDFQNIAINVFTNDLTSSKIWIDNVTICETYSGSDCDTIAIDSSNNPIIPIGFGNVPPGFACISEAEEDEYFNGSLTDLYGQLYGYDGTTNWYDNATDKCWSLGGTLPDEVINYNCNDSLKTGSKINCDDLMKYLQKPDLDGLDYDKLPNLPPINSLNQNCQPFLVSNDDPKLAFGGRDIIYIHGLELDHVVKRVIGDKEALANWPLEPNEFYKSGYYKEKAENTWSDHIKYFQKNYNNRHLVVSYNCSQRLEVAVHSVLTQIYEAMQFSRDVVNLNDSNNIKCFGREYVIISQSTGAIIGDVLLAIANQTKTDPALAAKWGNIGYIADRCIGHIARRGAFSGSDLATILVTLAKPSPGAAAISMGLLLNEGGQITDLANPNNSSVIRSSILVDLIPPIARSKWGPWEDKVPVPVLTVSGGHPTFFDDKEINSIATYGLGGVGALVTILPIFSANIGVVITASTLIPVIQSTALTALTTALSMKHIVHPGFDDGVITTDCATGRKSTFTNTSTFHTNHPLRVFDMGLEGPRAVHYYLDQRKVNSLTNFHSGASPYLSPSGMVQPVSSFSLQPSYKNHYTFIQAASEHWIKHGEGPYPQDCCDYKTTAIGGSSNNEEQLVVSQGNLFNQSNGIIHQSIISEMGEHIKGRYIWVPSIKYIKKFGVIVPIPWYKKFWIWKRTYHNLKNPNLYDCDYVYKYLFKN